MADEPELAIVADRAAAHAMLSVCNDVMATILASDAPDRGTNNAEAKINRICRKIEMTRRRAQRLIDEARAGVKQ